MIFETLRYRLKPDGAHTFAHAMTSQSEALHAAAGIEIVFHGALDGDPLTYVLVRSFADAQTMAQQLQNFYASSAWRDGPRQTIVNAIEHAEQSIVPESKPASTSSRAPKTHG